MKLVVGLGNPGRRYEGTRHNVGFEVVAAMARQLAAGPPKTKFEGELAEVDYRGTRILLLCPLTYMNLSGRSVQAARDFYQLGNDGLLIACDDFQLPVGRIRFRPHGSSGGQKGLEDAIRRCGADLPRLRIGIGPVPPQWNPADFVLGRFQPAELAEIRPVITRAAQAVLDWIEHGLQYCMNTYNGPAVDPPPRTARN